MARTRVKICGTTSVRDALLAQEAGADAIGLIFAPSRRRVTVAQAREIGEALDPATTRVGVFLGHGLDEVLRIAREARLGAVQLHGPLSPVYIETVLRYHPVLRALRVGDPLPRPGVTVLLDAPTPGSGEPLDWAALRASFPAGGWLAGGLGPANVAEAMALLRPAAVDAVSALEASPGVKDPARVQAFVAAVRAADAALEQSYPQ